MVNIASKAPRYKGSRAHTGFGPLLLLPPHSFLPLCQRCPSPLPFSFRSLQVIRLQVISQQTSLAYQEDVCKVNQMQEEGKIELVWVSSTAKQSLHLQIRQLDSEVPSPVAQQQMFCLHPSSEGSISELTTRVLVEIQVFRVMLAFNNINISISVVSNTHISYILKNNSAYPNQPLERK